MHLWCPYCEALREFVPAEGQQRGRFTRCRCQACGGTAWYRVSDTVIIADEPPPHVPEES